MEKKKDGAKDSEDINFHNKAIRYRILKVRLFLDIQKKLLYYLTLIILNVYLLIRLVLNV